MPPRRQYRDSRRGNHYRTRTQCPARCTGLSHQVPAPRNPRIGSHSQAKASGKDSGAGRYLHAAANRDAGSPTKGQANNESRLEVPPSSSCWAAFCWSLAPRPPDSGGPDFMEAWLTTDPTSRANVTAPYGRSGSKTTSGHLSRTRLPCQPRQL